MKNVFITGIDGFTGQHLRARFEAAGYRVTGLSSEGTSRGPVYQGDLLDRDRIREIVSAEQPDYVVHLAAISFVAHGDAQAIYDTNIVGSRNLLEALAGIETPPKKVVLASSANIYGRAEDDPITEATPPAPANDYAVSKLAMEHMANLWMERLPIVIARPFNYTGPGQAAHFLIPKIVNHFRDRAKRIELGNLDVARDFSDIRFVCEAYCRLLTAGQPGEVYNICSGKGTRLDEIIEQLREITGHSLEVHVNPEFVRSNEIKWLRGSNQKLLKAVGTIPAPTLRDTLEWMVEAPE